MVQSHKPIETVGIITKRTVDVYKKPLRELVTFLKKHKKKIVFDTNSCKLYKEQGFDKEKLLGKVDLAVVLGGDGTLLKTARKLPRKKTLILGINLGNVGFLTECTPDKMLETLEKILKNKYTVDKRSLLRATIYRKGKKLDTSLALNDVVINQGAFARLITMELEINNRKVVEFKADGMIIATPTGSTAHSLSAGGPIVHPKVESFTATPICPSSLSMRPIVLPDTRVLTITIETQRKEESAVIGLTIDGQDVIDLKYGDKIKIRRSERSLYLARTKNHYYKILRTKLHWGEHH